MPQKNNKSQTMQDHTKHILNEEIPEKFRNSPQNLVDYKYRNIDTNLNFHSQQKIPSILHHIWVTNPQNPRQIPQYETFNLIETSKKLALYPGWIQILWVNDKIVLSPSLKKLKHYNITIKEISEHRDSLTNLDIAEKEIEAQNWGTASDIIRYDVVSFMGGIYADVNYQFARIPNEETTKYDFFGFTFSFGYLFVATNCIFGAIQKHPILLESQALVKRNFINPPQYIDNSLSKKDFTYFTTAIPLGVAYLKKAHSENFIDVLYPPSEEHCALTNTPKDNKELKDFFFKIELYTKDNHKYFYEILEQELCLNSSLQMGTDPQGAETWLT